MADNRTDDERTDLEAQVRHALDAGKMTLALERYLAGSDDRCLTDRERKLLQLLQDAIRSGHVQRLCQ